MDRSAEIAALTQEVTAAGGARVGVRDVVSDLRRRLRRTFAPHPRLLGRRVHRALTWEAADRRDRNWWPQGISTAEHTEVTAPVLVTSWYAKDDQGVRISVLDLQRRRYEHVLLVVPERAAGTDGGTVTVRPLRVHAGGLVWHRNRLHVAATRRGFWTGDLDDILRLPEATGAGSPLAESWGGYRYVLPVRWLHRAESDEGVDPLRYSFLSLDRSTRTPSLVVGEYGSPRQSHRLARIAVDDRTGDLVTDPDGVARPTLVADDGPARMQGAVVVDGQWYLTASQGPWTFGAVHAGQPGRFTDHWWATPMGPEDLTWTVREDLLWSTTEHPRRRWIFAMRRTEFDTD